MTQIQKNLEPLLDTKGINSRLSWQSIYSLCFIANRVQKNVWSLGVSKFIFSLEKTNSIESFSIYSLSCSNTLAHLISFECIDPF